MNDSKQGGLLLIDSSYPINVRNRKIVKSLREHYPNKEVHIVAWNRDNRPLMDDDISTHVFFKNVAYGNVSGKLRFLYAYFCFIKELNLRLNPAVIIASHWDMLFLTFFIKRKKQILVYENLDIPTSQNFFLLKTMQLFERLALKKVDVILFASRFYPKLYKSFLGKKIVIENKPFKSSSNQSSVNSEEKRKLNISYIGLVRYIDILENLVDAVRDEKHIQLNIFGEGQDLDALKNYSSGMENIFFGGQYHYSDIINLYEKSDIVWAAYPSKDFNVKYAISNKFHESIAYKVPCIYSQDTELGKYVIEEGIGFVVDPYSKSDIKALMNLFVDHVNLIEAVRVKLESKAKTEGYWDDSFSVVKGELDSLVKL